MLCIETAGVHCFVLNSDAISQIIDYFIASAGLFGYDESENGTAYFGAQYL